MAARRLLGAETPRVWTRPVRELTPETSRGFAVIRFAEELAGIRLLPWQKWLLVHMLEEREDGSLRFRQVIVEVARQNGKTTLAAIFCLWRMFIDGSTFVLSTAQSLETSEATLQEAIDLVNASPGLRDEVAREVRTAGKKALVLTSGARWQVAALSRKTARSKSIDTVLFDELREHLSWDAWEAVTNTTLARPDAIILGISNAGDASSVVLRTRREKAIEQIDAGGPVAYFGWTADPDAAIDDREAWAQANPALGYTVTLEALESQFEAQTERGWRTENLCQWVTAARTTFLDSTAWEGLVDPSSQIAGGGTVWGGVDVSADRSYTSVSVAGWRPDGLAHVEVIAVRAGMLWLPDFIRQVEEATPEMAGWVIQARGCAAAEFVEPLRAAGHHVVTLGGSDLGAACGQFRDRVRDGGLRHRDQPALNVAAFEGTARRVGGDAMVWDRSGSTGVDIAPLVAATWALWGLNREGLDTPARSAYTDMSQWWRALQPATAAGRPVLSGDGEDTGCWWRKV